MPSPSGPDAGGVIGPIPPSSLPPGEQKPRACAWVDLRLAAPLVQRLERVFADLCGSPASSGLPHNALVTFMAQVQGEDATQQPEAGQKPTYDFEVFVDAWLTQYGGLDASCSLRNVPLDLSRPITDYFINSSHNTYLSGNQLYSKSSPESYRSVLDRGCRCVEIDIWNGDASPKRSLPENDSHHDPPARSMSLAAEMIEKVGSKVDQILARHESVSNGVGTALPASAIPTADVNPVLRHSALPHPHPFAHPQINTFAKDEPMVTHGWTLTTPCGFREVCRAVRESAFASNELPIIASLEVHANHDQQAVAVRIMQEEWGDLLVQHPPHPSARVPLLGELRHKILVKVKRAPAARTSESESLAGGMPERVPDKEVLDSDSDVEDMVNPLSTRTHSMPLVAQPAPSSSSNRLEAVACAPALNENRKSLICPELSDLAVYTRGEKFRGFDAAEARMPHHVFSLKESCVFKLHESRLDRQRLQTHNRDYLMRIYPSRTRITSSNFDPVPFWRDGAQMVALNWQHLDAGTMLNHAMFADGPGWVPKRQQTERLSTLDLRITVLAGQHLVARLDAAGPAHATTMPVRPLVQCQLHIDPGVHGQDSRTDGDPHDGGYKRKVLAPHRSDNPDFGPDGVTLQFLGVPNVVEDMTFLRLKLKDGANRMPLMKASLMSWACVRLDRLRQGYRLLQLRDGVKGQEINGGFLLVRIEKTFR